MCSMPLPIEHITFQRIEKSNSVLNLLSILFVNVIYPFVHKKDSAINKFHE